MTYRKLSVIFGALALFTGVGVGGAIADNSPSAPSCENQAGQQGPDEQQATANAVSDAAAEVEQEADNEQADDQAGDQQGPNDQSDEQGESNQGENDQCGDEGGD